MLTRLLILEKPFWARLYRGLGIDLERDFLRDQADTQIHYELFFAISGNLQNPVNAIITNQVRGPIAVRLRET